MDTLLVSGATNQEGFYVMSWVAEPEPEGTIPGLEIYAWFPGTSEFDASKAPLQDYYSLLVTLIGTSLSLDTLSTPILTGETLIFSGRLIRSETGTGIAGETILIREFDGTDICLLFCDNSTLASGVTDEDGFFSIQWIVYCEDNEDPCNLEIFARFDRTETYEGSNEPVNGWYDVEVFTQFSTRLALDQVPTQVVEGEMIVFTGRLVDETTNIGLSGQTVYVYDFDRGAFGISDDLLGSDITDSGGYFSIFWEAQDTDVQDNLLEIYAWFSGTPEYRESKGPATAYYVMEIVSSIIRTKLTIELPQSQARIGDSITFVGRLVREDTGVGISGAMIQIFDYDIGPFGEQDDLLASGLTDQDGFFAINWIAEPELEGNVPGQEVYAWFPGTDEYEPSKAPTIDYYSLEVFPQDITPPVITISHNPIQPAVGETVIFTAASLDEPKGSGLTEIRLFVDGLLVRAERFSSEGGNIIFEGGPYPAGPHNYYGEAIDGAGNVRRDPARGVKTFAVGISPVKISSVLTLNPIQLRVSEGSQIIFAGRLTDTTLRGIPNVIVLVFDDDGDQVNGDMLASGLTDTQGQFSIPWTVSCTDPLQDPCSMEIYAYFPGTVDHESSRGPRIGNYIVESIPVIVGFIGQVGCFGLNCEGATFGVHSLEGFSVVGYFSVLPRIELEISWVGGSSIAYADSNGRYEFVNIPLYGPAGKNEFTIEARLTDNKFLRILDCSQNCYLPQHYFDQYIPGEIFSKVIKVNPSSGSVQTLEPILFGTLRESDAASIYIYNWLMADFYETHLGVELGNSRPIDVNIFASSSYSYYWNLFPDNRRHIAIRSTSSPSLSPTWKDTVGMEYGHYIHYVAGGAYGSNSWMKENFGNFMAEAISAELGDQIGVGFFGYLCQSIESGRTSHYRDPTDTQRGSPTYDNWGIYCPMASILWDFYDTPQTPDNSRLNNEDDIVDVPLRVLWDIFSSEGITSLDQLYLVLTRLDVDQNGLVDSRDLSLVNSIFDNHDAPGGRALN